MNPTEQAYQAGLILDNEAFKITIERQNRKHRKVTTNE